jgi:hypothetical protein
MPARVLAFRNALLLLKAPATVRDRSVLRTALDLTFAFRFVVRAVLRLALVIWLALVLRSAWVLRSECAVRLTEVFEMLWAAEVLLLRKVVRVAAWLTLPLLTLAWKLVRAGVWDIAGLALRVTAGRALTCATLPPPCGVAPPPRAAVFAGAA